MPAHVRAAYGLALEGDVDVLGADPAPVATLRGAVAVVSAPAATQEARARVFTQRNGAGAEAVTLDRGAATYEMRIAGLASFVIARDGRRIVCRPEAEHEWHWQRVLAGHALPMAALLQGIEVLHAAGVVLGGHGVAIAASSQGGKSSLSVNLALRGAGLLSDDALAAELDGEGVVVHPGVAASTLRAPEVERLRELGLLERLEFVGEHEGTLRVLLGRAAEPVPLGAVYWPERVPDGQLAFVRLEPDPRRVLTSTINLVLREPERLERHFRVATAIAAGVPLFRIEIPPGVGAAETAAALERHALAA
jgi:hypothetical protein